MMIFLSAVSYLDAGELMAEFQQILKWTGNS